MQIKIILISVALLVSLTHCASYDFSRRVISQGNLLSETKLNKLKVGMSKNDVAIVMGSSLLNPSFSKDRWDYAFTTKKANGPLFVKHIVIYFNQDRVTRIQRSQTHSNSSDQ